METESKSKSKKLEDNQKDSTKRNYFRVFATTQESEGSKYEQGRILDGGVIPSWLSGIYLKLGPGKFDFESKDKKKTTNSNSNSNKNKGSDKENHGILSEDVFTVNNYVDGYAIITKFSIDKGRVTLQKKFIQSDAYKKALLGGKPVLPESHTSCSPDPSKGFFRKFIPTLVPDMSDNTSHAFVSIGGSIFASNESYHLWRIDPETLETLKKYDSSKLLGVNQTSAHPISDDHHTFSVGTIMSATGCKYVIMKTPLNKDKNPHHNTKKQCSSPGDDDSEALSLFKQSKSICSISPWSMTLTAFMHSITITRHFAILVEQPFFTNLSKVAKTITFGKNFCYSDWMEYVPSGGQVTNRFYIIDKETGATLSSNIELYTKTPFYFSHFINSYEDKNEDGEEVLVIDVCGYKDTQVYQCPPLQLQSLRSNGPYKLEGAAAGLRFLIPLSILKSDNNSNKWNDSISGDNLLSEKCRDQYKIPITKSNNKNNKQSNIINTDSKSNGDGNGEQIDDDCASASAVKKDNNKIILTPQVFTERGVEWPIINKEFQGTNYKWFYGSSGFFKSDAYSNSLFKINMETGETIKYVDEHCIFGEPYFIPEPSETANGIVKKKNKKEEDAGVLLVTLHDTRDGKEVKDSLLILNAKDLKVMAHVVFDAHIPPSNHGLFIPT